jgi:hypothetical protein
MEWRWEDWYDRSGKKLARPYLSRTSWAWWYRLVNPAMWEAEVGMQSKATRTKMQDPI